VFACVCLRACACVRVLACVCLRACACVRVLACVCLRACACVPAETRGRAPAGSTSASRRRPASQQDVLRLQRKVLRCNTRYYVATQGTTLQRDVLRLRHANAARARRDRTAHRCSTQPCVGGSPAPRARTFAMAFMSGLRRASAITSRRCDASRRLSWTWCTFFASCARRNGSERAAAPRCSTAVQRCTASQCASLQPRAPRVATAAGPARCSNAAGRARNAQRARRARESRALFGVRAGGSVPVQCGYDLGAPFRGTRSRAARPRASRPGSKPEKGLRVHACVCARVCARAKCTSCPKAGRRLVGRFSTHKYSKGLTECVGRRPTVPVSTRSALGHFQLTRAHRHEARTRDRRGQAGAWGCRSP
jgi:hypothetical protein